MREHCSGGEASFGVAGLAGSLVREPVGLHHFGGDIGVVANWGISA